MKRFGRWIRDLLMALPLPDAMDIHVYGGIALIAVGCWLAYRPAGLIAPGLAILWLGLGAPGIGRPAHVRKERR